MEFMVYHQNLTNIMVRRRQAFLTAVMLVLIFVLTMASIMSSGERKRSRNKPYYFDISAYRDHHTRNLSKGSNHSTAKNAALSVHARVHNRLLVHKSGWNNSHTRLGRALNFDPSLSCPQTALMQGYYKRFKPKTKHCPQVFIIGAKKGGTTSLYQYLSKHPDFEGIRLNEPKWVGETFYFARKYMSMHLRNYLNMFPQDKMSGDASVDNFVECSVPSRIFKVCGHNKTKIILLLRNPVERYKSNFMMRVTRKEYVGYGENTSLADTIAKEVESLNASMTSKGAMLPAVASEWSKLTCLFGTGQNMIYEGLYYPLLMNWLCNFPKESLLILNSEEMYKRTPVVLSQVLQFLGLKPLESETLRMVTSQIYNQGMASFHSHHTLSSFHRDQLNYIYEPFNRALFKLLQWNNIDWS